jgi:hypothetical protein
MPSIDSHRPAIRSVTVWQDPWATHSRTVGGVGLLGFDFIPSSSSLLRLSGCHQRRQHNRCLRHGYVGYREGNRFAITLGGAFEIWQFRRAREAHPALGVQVDGTDNFGDGQGRLQGVRKVRIAQFDD